MATAARLGIGSVAELARRLETEPQYLFKAFAGDGKAHGSMVKLAELAQVSLLWLEHGDITTAPPWADRKRMILDAAKALAGSDRTWMLSEINRTFAQGDIDHAPNTTTQELAQLRADQTVTINGIRALHHQVLTQLDAVQRLANDLGIVLDGYLPTMRAASSTVPFQISKRVKTTDDRER